MFCNNQGPRAVGSECALARSRYPKREPSYRGANKRLGEPGVKCARTASERREGLTDSTKEKRDECPGPEPDEVHEMSEGRQREQGEEEVCSGVARPILPKDHHHCPIDHRAVGWAIENFSCHGGDPGLVGTRLLKCC